MKAAIIGCGAIAATHLNAILSAGQTVCALCDIVPGRAEALAARFGLSVSVYTDGAVLIDRECPDAVHICTPHHLHAEMSVWALRRNIHVLCEKPVCISMEQLSAVTHAAQESKAALGVCLQNRYEPNLLRLRELAQAEGIRAALGVVCWKRDEAYYRSGDWRGKQETEGGGVMINQALHTLDLLQWICGMPAYVTAHLSNDHLPGVIEVEDTADALFEVPDGLPVNFFATTAAGADFPAQVQLVTCQNRVLYADSRLLVEHGEVMPQAQSTPAPGKAVWGGGHRALIADFYRCAERGEEFPVTVQEGGKVLRLILAMYASGGRRIAVPPAV